MAPHRGRNRQKQPQHAANVANLTRTRRNPRPHRRLPDTKSTRWNSRVQRLAKSEAVAMLTGGAQVALPRFTPEFLFQFKKIPKEHAGRGKTQKSNCLPIYSSLNTNSHQIRLLRLHPSLSGDNEPIEADLITTSLWDAQYDALSYCWGHPEPRQKILVNGQDVEVGPALHDALRHLRKSNEAVLIWADAICINQLDVDERNHQVQQMASIYSQAQSVQVWLGSADPALKLPLDLIDQWASVSSDTFYSLSFKLRNLDFVLSRFSRGSQRHALLAIHDFRTRPYWSRLWIVQELALAKQATIHYGGQSISLEYLLAIGSSIKAICGISKLVGERLDFSADDSWNVDRMLTTLSSLKMVRARLHREIGLTTKTVASLASRQTSDPRDKIYALGISDDAEDIYQRMISPDYSKRVEQVFTDFARYAIQSGETLDILQFSGLQDDPSSALPSWVPDWRCVSAESRGVYYHRRPQCVSGVCDGSVSLRVRGRKIDTVDELLPMPSLSSDDNKASSERHSLPRAFVYQFLADWMSSEEVDTEIEDGSAIIRDSRPRDPAALAKFFQLFTKVKSGSESPRELEKHSLDHIGAQILHTWAKAGHDNVGKEPEVADLAYSQQLSSEFRFLTVYRADRIEEKQVVANIAYNQELFMTFRYLSRCRANGSIMFKTKKGYTGFGSPKVRPGDEIFCLAPYDAMFALRPCDKGRSSAKNSVAAWFSNAGKCYGPRRDFPRKGELLDDVKYVDIEIR